MEIKFSNRKELEKYLNYLEGIEINKLNSYTCNPFDRNNLQELFLDDIVDTYFTNNYSSEDNKYISKLVWGIWVEDGESLLDNLYNYDYDKWDKYTQCFKECFNTNWEEERREKEKLEREYSRQMEELNRKYTKQIVELNKKYKK